MTWTKLHLTVTTPVFNSDGNQEHAEIRVPSIRGAMRFWLRAMAGVMAGNDLRALSAIEHKVMGSTAHSSPVKLRIPHQPASSDTSHPDFLRSSDHNKWISYLLGPGLTSWSPQERMMLLNRAHIPPGQDFELWLRFTGDDTDAHLTALAALWLTFTYGGIGARTRRGFGGIRITGITDLPEKWSPDSFRTPCTGFYERTRSLWPTAGASEGMPALINIAKNVGLSSMFKWSASPTYPVLSRDHTVAGVSGGETFTSWEDVLCWAGRELRYFRATTDTPGVRYHPEVKTHEWLEVVNGPEEEFPLGALGLPIVFKKQIEVHADRDRGSAAEKLRRASPLWLRPVGLGEYWRLFSFGFLAEFLPGPDQPTVHLWKDRRQGKKLVVTTEDAHAGIREWVTGMADREDRDGVFSKDRMKECKKPCC